MRIDYKKVIQARENRSSRLPNPFANYFASFQQCADAGESVVEGSFPQEFTPLMERSVVISTVTAIEVYYRDVLDGMFRYCSPEFFEPHIAKIHDTKYGIPDLLEMHLHKIHPLELVSSSQSFQSAEKIEKIFSRFLGKGLWASVLDLQVRRKDQPDNVASWCKEDLEGLKATFSLRHELVHDPARKAFLTDEIMGNLWKASHMVFGSDVLLMEMMGKNQDTKLVEQDDA